MTREISLSTLPFASHYAYDPAKGAHGGFVYKLKGGASKGKCVDYVVDKPAGKKKGTTLTCAPDDPGAAETVFAAYVSLQRRREKPYDFSSSVFS